MDRHFQKELDGLRLKVLEMAAYAEKAVDKAARALVTYDTALAEEVMDGDHAVDALECEVDDYCLRLLALGQPVAADLRFVVGCMRMAGNLERMGDQAVNIAERAMFLAQRPPLPFNHVLEDMADVARDMVRACINAFKLHNVEQARQVCAMDARADELDMLVLRKLMDYMINETPAIERSVHTILAVRNLERVCDLATNIAEVVIFVVHGANVKHKCDHLA
ncbi:MAG: phosphate signaling complex protein PhoU [Desulfovibrionaceae bacterium]